jgi:cytochrome c554/c'-like protein
VGHSRFFISLSGIALIGGLMIANSLLAQDPVTTQEPATQAKKAESEALKMITKSDAVYVGASKCKSCHNKESKGEIYKKWTQMKHSNAMQALKSEDAIAYAKEVGIEKPHEAKECVKCHVTAFGVDKKKLHKRFKQEIGVQCETCHGPGSLHIKARLSAAKEAKKAGLEKVEGQILELPKGEMVLPDELLCRKCHNEESPSFKEFDFGERLEKIRHMHPNREKPRVTPPKKKAKKGAKSDGENG